MFAGSAAHTSHADLPFHKLHDRLSRIEADRDAKAQELRECKRSLREAQEQVAELRTARDRLTSENEAIKLALNEAKNGSQINARTIIAEVSVSRDVPIKAIMSSSRRHSIVLARHEAMYEVARRCPWLSLTEIGRTFDRDHTTVIHALTYWPSKANQLGIGVFPLGREVVE